MFNKSRTLLPRFGIILILLVGLLGATPARPALASTIIVTTINDSGTGSLRQAITDAATGDVITFSPSLAGQTITLASNLVINKDLTIDGSGLSPQVTVNGGNVAHIETTGDRSRNVTISSLTIANGYASGNGGAISSIGNLTIINSTLRNNHAVGDGGAIFSYGLVLKNTTVYQNQADSDGGAFAFTTNGYSVVIVNSTVSQNHAGSRGGAIYMAGNPVADVYNSTLADNSSPQGNEAMLIGNSRLTLYNTAFVCTSGDGDCYVTLATSIIDDSHSSLLGAGTLSDYGLSELNDNGGPTKTMALLSTSPLIDAGDDAICSNPPVNNLDQRGALRPQGKSCDMGAYEYGDTTPPTVKIVRAEGQVDPTNAASVDFTVIFSEPVMGVSMTTPFEDFALTTTGVTDASITNIRSSSETNTSYTVTVNTGAGNGTIRLDMPATATISDIAGNFLKDLPFTDGEAFTIEKAPILYRGKYDDREKALMYTGAWKEFDGIGPYLKTYTYSTEGKDFAMFSFRGNRFALTYTQSISGGMMYIYVDDFTKPVAVLNQNGRLAWQRTWTSGTFALGTHSVKLMHVSGIYVNIDAVEVYTILDIGALDDKSQ